MIGRHEVVRDSTCAPQCSLGASKTQPRYLYLWTISIGWPSIFKGRGITLFVKNMHLVLRGFIFKPNCWDQLWKDASYVWSQAVA
jgi:hypothetical protein